MTLAIKISDSEISLGENLTGLKTKLKELIENTKMILVRDESSFNEITSLYKISKNWEKKIESARKEANAPDQDRINARNDRAKAVVGLLKELQGLANTKAEDYSAMLEMARKKEATALAEASQVLGFEIDLEPQKEESIRGQGANLATRTVRKFRTVDLTKVPFKYLQVNEALVERDINKFAVDQIEGLEIYEEKTTYLRTR